VSCVDHDFARDWQELFDHPVDAGVREGRVTDDPLPGPGQEVMGQVRQQDQRFLGRQPLLTPSVQLQASLIGLQLGFDRGAVILRLGRRR
jgi:hypothetical protein